MQVVDREKIELFVSGRNLRDKDILSKSDPFFVVTNILYNIDFIQGKKG